MPLNLANFYPASTAVFAIGNTPQPIDASDGHRLANAGPSAVIVADAEGDVMTLGPGQDVAERFTGRIYLRSSGSASVTVSYLRASSVVPELVVTNLVPGTGVSLATARANAAAINAALIAAAGTPVRIPAGTYVVAAAASEPVWGGCIKMPTGSSLRAHGATIQQIAAGARHLVCNASWSASANGAALPVGTDLNINISGGAWDNNHNNASTGLNPAGSGAYNVAYSGGAFLFVGVRNIRIEDVAAQWTARSLFRFSNCSRVVMRDLVLTNTSHGVKISGGCSDVTIDNVRGDCDGNLFFVIPRDIPDLRIAPGNISNVILANVLDGGIGPTLQISGGRAADNSTQLTVRGVQLSNWIVTQKTGSTADVIRVVEDSGDANGQIDLDGVILRDGRVTVQQGNAQVVNLSGQAIGSFVMDGIDLVYSGTATDKRLVGVGASVVTGNAGTIQQLAIRNARAVGLDQRGPLVDVGRTLTDTITIRNLEIDNATVEGPLSESGTDWRNLVRRLGPSLIERCIVQGANLRRCTVWSDESASAIPAGTTDLIITDSYLKTSRRSIILRTNARVNLDSVTYDNEGVGAGPGFLPTGASAGQELVRIDAASLVVTLTATNVIPVFAITLFGRGANTGTFRVIAVGPMPLGLADLTVLTPTVGDTIRIGANITAGTLVNFAGTTITPGSGGERGMFMWNGSAWRLMA